MKRSSSIHHGKASEKRKRPPAVENNPAQVPLSRRPWRLTLQGLFRIDPRSLALFRIILGTLLLTDLAVRSGDLKAMYTDGGMFTRTEICYRVTSFWNWSFHFANGSWEFQAVLFGIAAALAISLVLGLETRVATIGSWLLLVSLHHRVPPILSGADILLRMLLFWAMFLPLGLVWSFDAWRAKPAKNAGEFAATTPIFSAATAAILLQMAQVYFFSAIFKTNSGWLRGEIIAGTLAHNFYATSLGTYLLQFPRLLTAVTVGVLVLEWVAPLFLFALGSMVWIRVAIITALALMHLGIAALLEVDLFSWVSIAGLTLFLPTKVWDCCRVAAFPSVAGSASRTERFGRQIRTPPWVTNSREAICLFVLAYVLVTNIKTLPGQTEWINASFLRTACGLAQKWNMFDEVPSKNGWYVAWAKLRDGSNVDLLRHGAALDWRKPEYPAALYPSYRWRKVFREMAYEDILGYQVFRAPIAQYLCRSWNLRHELDQQVKEFDFVFCTESKTDLIGRAGLEITQREPLVHLRRSQIDGALTVNPEP